MIGPLDLAHTTRAGGQRRMIRVPAARVGGDMHDPAVRDMGVDDAAPAAIMTASAGDDGFRHTRAGCWPRGLVNRLARGLILVGQTEIPCHAACGYIAGRASPVIAPPVVPPWPSVLDNTHFHASGGQARGDRACSDTMTRPARPRARMKQGRRTPGSSHAHPGCSLSPIIRAASGPCIMGE